MIFYFTLAGVLSKVVKLILKKIDVSESKNRKRTESGKLMLKCTDMTHLTNFECFWYKSVWEQCSKIIGAMKSISKSMSSFSGDPNHLVKIAIDDKHMIYSTNDENVIQLFSMIKHKHGEKGPKKSSSSKSLDKNLATFDAKIKRFETLTHA